MAIARTEEEVATEVEWHSSSVPVEELDRAISRDRNLTLRWAEQLLVDCGPTHSSSSSAS